MKMKLHILTAIIWLSGISVTMAQVVASAGTTIEGSPYLNETYADAEIHYEKGKPTKLPARYNAYQDIIEYKQNGQSYVIDPTTKIKKINLGEETFVVDKFDEKGRIKYGFLTLLDSGKVMLLSKKSIMYADAKMTKAMDGTDVKAPAKFSKLPDTYYYKIGNGELQKFKNVKKMIESLPDQHEALTKYAKEEKISSRNEAELIQFVRYYNAL
jgi:hypothetical protein